MFLSRASGSRQWLLSLQQCHSESLKALLPRKGTYFPMSHRALGDKWEVIGFWHMWVCGSSSCPIFEYFSAFQPDPIGDGIKFDWAWTGPDDLTLRLRTCIRSCPVFNKYNLGPRFRSSLLLQVKQLLSHFCALYIFSASGTFSTNYPLCTCY